MAEHDLVVSASLSLPLAELHWRFSASGGPGGQHVNTSNTKAEVTFDVEASPSLTEEQRLRLCSRLGSVIRVVVSEERSQLRNRQVALERLATRISEALEVPRARRATRPSRSSQRRRVDSKRIHGSRKHERGGSWASDDS